MDNYEVWQFNKYGNVIKEFASINNEKEELENGTKSAEFFQERVQQEFEQQISQHQY